MAVPNIFASATSAIPLSQLDQNFATAITLGNTAVYLGNTTTSLGNVTLTNVTISSGNVTLTGANVSGTANVSTLIVTGNQTSLGNVAITGNVSANIATFSAGTAALPSITTTGDTNTGIFFPAADTIAFSEGGAEAARFDSAGNFGLGVTPSAWGSGHKAIQIGSTSVTNSSGDFLNLVGNAYYNGTNWIAQLGDTCALYQVNNGGAFVWSQAPVTTAGATATFTERMRLDASGNLGIGTTSPQAKLEAYQSSSGSTAQVLRLTNPNTAANTGAGIQWNLSSSTATINGEISVFRDAATSGTMVFKNAYATGGALTESMRIDSSGNVGIGITTPGCRLDATVNNPTRGIVQRLRNESSSGQTGAQFQFTQNAIQDWVIGQPAGVDAFAFWSGRNPSADGTERMRIDSSGNLLVGTTSQYTQTAHIVTNTSTASYGIAIRDTGATTALINFANSAGTQIGNILVSGGTGVSYNTSSDYRLKENIAPMTGALAKVTALKPCTYTWKSNGSDSQGFIAHELAEVVPQCVTGKKDAVNEDGSINPQGIDTSFLVATLTAAIQELNAKFEEYKAAHP